MSLLKFILSYLFFFLLLLKMITSQETCSSTQCSTNGPRIDYPFGVKNCAYPGFNIACDSMGKTVLELPNIVGDFFVESIAYGTKEIKLSDPKNCLPYRYLQSRASLSNLSPFMGFSSRTYAFYDCPQYILNDPVAYQLSNYALYVSCVSLSSGAVLITTPASTTDSSQMIINQGFIDYGCRLRDYVSIPIPESALNNVYSKDAMNYLYLRWTEPRNDDPKGGPPAPRIGIGGPPAPGNGIGNPGTPGNDEKSSMQAFIMGLIVVAVVITLLVCLTCGPKAGKDVGLGFCELFAQGIPCCLGIYGFYPCTCCCPTV